jgi:hypothetical protein
MHHDSIHFQGSYRYASPADLERALASARRWLDEEELYDLDGDWLACFVASGATLRIDTQLPIEADRFAAVAVMEELAREALEGIVEARRGELRLDAFPCGVED